jgi:hypothetical protein
MNTPAVPPDAERELAALRARAYGPDADIHTDAAALARLWELETAHRPKSPELDNELDAAVPSLDREPVVAPSVTERYDDGAEPAADISPDDPGSEDSPPSGWRRAVATPAGRTTAVVGALAAVLAAGYAVGWLVGPHPDATLRPAADEASTLALSMIDFLGVQADVSTVRGYERYQGIEPWFFEDELGFHCFMLVTAPAFVDGANCVPPGVDLFADMIPWTELVDENSEPLPAGSIIRFHYLEDRVDVDVYTPSQAD